jgi:hypothetical protein
MDRADEAVREAAPRSPPPAPGAVPASVRAGGVAAGALAGGLASLDPGVARGIVRALSGASGNAAVARALAPPGVEAVRARVESATGYDLSEAVVHHASPAAAVAGAQGLAVGRDVHLAPGVSPRTAHGAHVLAHELAHVVQQGSGAATGIEAPGRRRALEADAEAVAVRSASAPVPAPLPAAPLPAPLAVVVQPFDPRYHRTSLVGGLEGSGFTPDEIGMIYAANWERDLSQAHPALGNVILAWKSVKVAAYEGRLSDADIAAFQGACQSVLEQALLVRATTGSFDAFMEATAYGGYQFYEHMDNPEGTPQAAQMKVVLAGKNVSGLPDHIYISREYIKEMLFEAARLSHPDLAGTPTAAAASSSAETRAKLGAGPGIPTAGGLPAASVAAETSHEVQQGTAGAGGGGASLDPRAYDLIGRASHALQDFWSHSNFVERAIGDPDFELGGLTTGTFGDDDKSHALAHKIRGAADEIDAEMPLIDRMTGRRATDPSPGEVNVGDESPVHHDDEKADLAAAILQAGDVLRALPGAAVSSFGRGYVRGSAGRSGLEGVALGLLSGLEGAVVGTVGSLAGSRAGVYALRQLAEKLEEGTKERQEAAGDYRAHGLLAKDQPGHEDDASGRLKTAKFELARALSVEADRRVTARMRGVVDAPTAAEADARLQDIFTEIDALIADAVPGHPLWGVVESHRAKAERALNDYLASKPGAGDLVPATPPTAVPV